MTGTGEALATERARVKAVRRESILFRLAKGVEGGSGKGRRVERREGKGRRLKVVVVDERTREGEVFESFIGFRKEGPLRRW